MQAANAPQRNLPGGEQRPPPKNRRTWLLLAAILLGGLLLRGLYLGELVEAPDFGAPVLDGGFHDYWARGLVTGDWSPPEDKPDPLIRSTPYFRPPGYPFFLALIYLVAGPNHLAAAVVQMSLGLLSAVLAFFLGRMLFGHVAGLILAAFMSGYWAFVYFEGELLAPALVVFLVLALILVLGTWTSGITLPRALGAGLLFGASAVVRPNVLLFAPAILAWAWWVGHHRNRRRFFALAASGFLAGAALIIAPVTLRNYRVGGDLVLISCNGPVNLYIGNNEASDGVSAVVPGAGATTRRPEEWNCFMYPSVVRELEATLGRPMGYSEASAYFVDRALRFLRRHPLRVLELTVRKALLFWGPAEISNNKTVHYERENSPTLRFGPGFPSVMSLAVLGVALLVADFKRLRAGQTPLSADSRRRLEASVLILLFAACYFVSFLPFFISARFRVPVIPFLLLFGAYGLHRVGCFVWVRDFRRGAFWVVVWAGLYFLAGRPLVSYEPDQAWWHFCRGVAYGKKGDLAHAVEEYRASLGINPVDAAAHYNLGTALGEMGRTQPAIEALEKAVALDRTYLNARMNLAQLLVLAGQLDQAVYHYRAALDLSPDDAFIRGQLARALAGLGLQAGRADLLQTARQEARRALELDPDQGDALLALGLVSWQGGRPAEALESLRRAAALAPGDQEARFYSGMAYLQQGDRTAAMEAFRQTLRLEPKHVVAANKLAGILNDAGDHKAAIEVLRRVLVQAPENPAARLNLARLLATCPDDALRDGPRALELARQAVARLGRHTPRSLFVLAAAYAACGRFDDAVRTQSQAIERARQAGQTRLAEEWSLLLERYRAGRAYHQAP